MEATFPLAAMRARVSWDQVVLPVGGGVPAGRHDGEGVLGPGVQVQRPYTGDVGAQVTVHSWNMQGTREKGPGLR